VNDFETITVDNEAGRATITLNRPDVHNAFDERLIAELTTAAETLSADHTIRAVVLTGADKSFSAGADLNWMKRMAGYSEAENKADARKAADMLAALASMPQPTVARVNGAAFGGGVGLVSACDIAVGADTAVFSLSEVKLGLIPAVISPYVIGAMGKRQAGRYMVSGERFDAAEARRIGLLHEVVPADELDDAVDEMVAGLLANGPLSMAECKALIRAVADRPVDEAVRNDTAERIARMRASDEGKEGVAAFLEKRKPNWIGGG